MNGRYQQEPHQMYDRNYEKEDYPMRQFKRNKWSSRWEDKEYRQPYNKQWRGRIDDDEEEDRHDMKYREDDDDREDDHEERQERPYSQWKKSRRGYEQEKRRTDIHYD